jgi:UDP-N-acetylglucosamine diphosphorylase / glucose-1-phosphate thymidylyltransferase / UDP-N-acetylgalactosamine diphosphorylase / glucosamine-1-phosphate N-acetyltransferase / galactosamine-1-phosphate N-acetyltransferase
MAAGEGTRLRPLTERWPKPVLPIDGRPAVVTLIHDLAAAGIVRFAVVTGYLADQVEALTAPLPYEIRFARQPEPLGSAHAVSVAEPEAPFVAVAADTKFARGDLARFVRGALDADGAVAVRRQPERPDYTRIHVDDGRVVRFKEASPEGEWTAAPLMALGPRVARFLDPLPGRPPYELADVFQLAIDDGAVVSAIQIGRTRDITSPVDLVRENFPYLR